MTIEVGEKYFKNKSIIMRKLMMKMSMSIDGFVGGPNGENDWVFRSSDETSRAWSVEQNLGGRPDHHGQEII